MIRRLHAKEILHKQEECITLPLNNEGSEGHPAPADLSPKRGYCGDLVRTACLLLPFLPISAPGFPRSWNSTDGPHHPQRNALSRRIPRNRTSFLRQQKAYFPDTRDSQEQNNWLILNHSIILENLVAV